MRAALAVFLALNLLALPVASKGVVVVVDDRMTVTGSVHFQTGNAVFAADAAALLDDIAAAITSDADIDILVVEGHTDSVGDPATNRALSQKRAEAVVDALAARGVARHRLVAKGFGDTVPVATNSSAAGREANRRVEFTIVVRAGKATATAALPLAKIASRLNIVDAKAPEAAAWQKGDIGLPLYRAWRVNTKEQSSADVAFRDTSRIHLRETTLIVIFGDNAYEKKEQRRATLETGALVSRIDELLGGATVVVDTPAGSAELGKGRAVVATDDRTSRVSNHRGDMVRVRGKTRKATPSEEVAVDVAPGMGTRVAVGTVPEPPRPLPPSPRVEGNVPPVATWEADVSVLSFAWSPGPGVVEVLVEVRDAADQVVFQARAPGTVRAVEARGLPRGDYAVQLSVVDEAGLESIPAEFGAIVGTPPPAAAPVEPGPAVAAATSTDTGAAPAGTQDDGAEPDDLCSSPLCPLLLGLVVVGGVAATITTIIVVGEASR